MVANVDIANRALSAQGGRSQIASLNENSNEARAVNLWLVPLRDELLRMAPWNCATNYNNLSLLKSAPGTPENPSEGAAVWSKAIPPPPWAYEYAYPSDCIRPLWIVPQFSTGFSSGVPITTAVTGGAPNFWNGPPVRYKVAIDQDSEGDDMRVILCNQQQAILAYLKRVTNPDVMDPQFQQAWASALAGRVSFQLNGDKGLANQKLEEANNYIRIAREGDGNEGLTINYVTPDWIRARGILYPQLGYGADTLFDWGPMLTMY